MMLLKRVVNRLGGINGFILILYTTFVLTSHSISIFVDYSRTNQYVVRALCNSIIFSVAICPLVLRKARSFILRQETPLTVSEHNRWLCTASLIVFGYLLLAFIAYYPGGFGTDSLVQYEQAVTGQYIDWHPFLHTLLFFTFPLSLSGGWIGSIVLFQIILMSAAIIYALYTALRYTNKTFSLLVLLFFLLNPNTVNLFMHPVKDSAFAIGTLFLTGFSVNIFFSKGKWLRKPLHVILYIFVFACTTLMRHNAILFTVPFLVATLFYIPGKKRLILVAGTLALVLFVKVPLASILDVESPGRRKVETMGLPLNIIASVATYHPEALDDKTRTFAYQIAAPEVWESSYTYGNFNYIKSHGEANIAVVENYSVMDILSMAMSSLLRSPQEALAGIVSVTDPVYTLTDDYNAVFDVDVSPNEWGIKSDGIGILAKIYSAYANLTSSLLSHLVHFIGTMMLLLLVVILAKSNLKQWADWKRICLLLPVFVYNFGSMLLMTHRGDALRFFQYTFYLIPLYIVIFYGNYHEGIGFEEPQEKQ